MNFLKSLTDSINYEKNDKPFFNKNEFDGKVKSIFFHQNIVFITKGESINYFYDEDLKVTFLDKIKKILSYFY